MPVDPATEAIANDIVDQLIKQLEGINQVASYQISVSVEEDHGRGNAAAENRIVVETESIEPNEEEGESCRDHWRLVVNLYCIAPGSQNATDKPRKRMMRMHAAVWKCLRENLAHTLGDLAVDTTPGKAQFGLYTSLPALLLPVTIVFRTKQDNPFER